jgi:putative RecB family exonuclease
MDTPDHLSVSQIQKYLTCPLSYRFRYIDRITTGTKSSSFALGTSFHVAAEMLHRHLMNGGVRDLGVYRDCLADTLADEFGNFEVQCRKGEDREQLTDEGQRMVEAYVAYRTAQPGTPVAAEQRVERSLVNLRTGELLEPPCLGFIDLLEADGDQLTVVDLKTCARAYNQATVDTHLQLSGYALFLWMETERMPKLRIDAVVRNKTPRIQTLHTTRTPEDLIRFWNLARSVRRAITSGCFYPHPGSWACSGCEFTDACQHWGLN